MSILQSWKILQVSCAIAKLSRHPVDSTRLTQAVVGQLTYMKSLQQRNQQFDQVIPKCRTTVCAIRSIEGHWCKSIMLHMPLVGAATD